MKGHATLIMGLSFLKKARHGQITGVSFVGRCSLMQSDLELNPMHFLFYFLCVVLFTIQTATKQQQVHEQVTFNPKFDMYIAELKVFS